MLDNDTSNNNNCNPQNLPLDELKFALSGKDGVRRNVPALVSGHVGAPPAR